MTTLAWIFGIVGGLCAAMGIATAAGVVPSTLTVGEQFTATFWMLISAVLLLIAIAFAVGRKTSA